mmetsp:Transcript_13221/g.37551  ORF Transcript_13221/g.37551 Transcript_13221/m.37551 type:complete len:203 (+) Transcript_13221:569-1177(+)
MEARRRAPGRRAPRPRRRGWTRAARARSPCGTPGSGSWRAPCHCGSEGSTGAEAWRCPRTWCSPRRTARWTAPSTKRTSWARRPAAAPRAPGPPRPWRRRSPSTRGMTPRRWPTTWRWCAWRGRRPSRRASGSARTWGPPSWRWTWPGRGPAGAGTATGWRPRGWRCCPPRCARRCTPRSRGRGASAGSGPPRASGTQVARC